MWFACVCMCVGQRFTDYNRELIGEKKQSIGVKIKTNVQIMLNSDHTEDGRINMNEAVKRLKGHDVYSINKIEITKQLSYKR